ncbi:MAG: FmdE family protein [Syntrophomonadaceae bacterium]|nr:FmdE family protein [Syntrophomonadaceae bacterium]MDD3022725.1 FmdE family protein [Syntrophomonadaceae bacterium]
MNYFEADLEKANDFHGHICSGIVLGVRMARIGLNYLGIEDTLQNRNFVVYVEADRCIADAVHSVTGCSLGKRRLKWMDYGKMAASFIDINSNTGVRIVVNGQHNAPENGDIVPFWTSITDEELFKLEPVRVKLGLEDLPGKSLGRAKCVSCGEKIMDGRELVLDQNILCKACAGGAYYEKL